MIFLKKSKIQYSVLLFSTLVVAFFGCDRHSVSTPEISKGNIFITANQHGEIPLLALDGHWEFYWNQFLFHSDFKKGSKVKLDLMARVPHVWNKDEED